MKVEHKDMLGNIIHVGDTVAFAMNGGYAGVLVGTVVKLTPQMIKVQHERIGQSASGSIGRHIRNDAPKTISPVGTIVINELLKFCGGEK